MKIKSLLLGSAAAMVAVSGARAADVVVIEPEPVEYVRVCDAYGAGWFYIPGTENCIKFGGDFEYTYSAFRPHDEDIYDPTHAAGWRARLSVDVNNETQYGTLTSRMRLRGTGGANGADAFSGGTTIAGSPTATTTIFAAGGTTGSGRGGVVVDTAVIGLAGFRLGFADDYWSTAGSYGYYNAIFDGLYNYSQGYFLDYTWAANGWTATVGIESRTTAFGPGAGGNGYSNSGAFLTGTASQPDIYGGITYSGGGWYLAGIVYYDSSTSAAAYKFRADYDMSSIAPGLSVGGWYMGDDGDTDYVKGHAWGITAQTNLTDNLVLFGGYSEYSDQNNATSADFSQSQWAAGVRWFVVPGLWIQAEYAAIAWDTQASIGNAPAGSVGGTGVNGGVFAVRATRSF